MDIIAAYERYASEITDAPSRYHRYMAPAVVGAIMGRRLWFPLSYAKIYPHLWCCLIGPSTLVKKTTSIGIAEHIVSQVNEELILPHKYSVEKLYEIVADRPVGLMAYSELHLLLSLMTREYNIELKSTLTDWWDCPAVRTHATKGGGIITLRRPCLTILGGSTMEWLVEATKTRDIAAGFYPRWLFAICETSDHEEMALPPPRDETKLEAIVYSLKEVLTHWKMEDDTSGRMTITAGAEAAYRACYADYRRMYSSNAILGSFAARGHVYILKLAMVSAIARRMSTSIEAKDIGYGRRLVDESLTDVDRLLAREMGETKTDHHLNKLRKLLIGAGVKGMTFRELQKLGPLRRRDWLLPLVTTLEELGEIKATKEGKAEYFVYLNGGPRNP